ncbi:hypothetical protein CDAR_186671 [Caerostris darwini]|uniref:Uncharacterized protein n=1 Tax=Caerostris darwini TaxID=1538125 RepID=A0AAV4QXA0_9ARAC|nr:hypothetical protein CDAR_186671 [Caerostris darwini]
MIRPQKRTKRAIFCEDQHCLSEQHAFSSPLWKTFETLMSFPCKSAKVPVAFNRKYSLSQTISERFLLGSGIKCWITRFLQGSRLGIRDTRRIMRQTFEEIAPRKEGICADVTLLTGVPLIRTIHKGKLITAI